MAEHLPQGRVHPILTHPHPVLSSPCEPAGYMRLPDLERLAADLLATMYNAKDRGLAAPRIGVLRRVFVMDVSWKRSDPEPLLLLDPDISARSDKMVAALECNPSVPGQVLNVLRPAEIEISWFDLQGRQGHAYLSGDAARIAQREFDQLDGRLIVDIPSSFPEAVL